MTDRQEPPAAAWRDPRHDPPPCGAPVWIVTGWCEVVLGSRRDDVWWRDDDGIIHASAVWSWRMWRTGDEVPARPTRPAKMSP